MPRHIVLLAGLLLLGACATVDVGGPETQKEDPRAGILNLSDGRQFHILPEELNYSGDGTYIWPDGRQRSGTWRAGRLEGIGTETTASETYTGQWHEGQRHGHGELELADGSRYVGDFVAGVADGRGTQTSAGGVYRGSWRGGRFHGQGQFNNATGGAYQGQWQHGQRSGYGQETNLNGGRYEGDWLRDKPDGFGNFYYPNGTKFEGSWVAGARQGYGALTTAAGVHYEGTWRADQRHGYGNETRPDGSYYSGQWFAGQRHGHGTEGNADGTTHTGAWVEDVILGNGLRTNRAGVVISGDWQLNNIETGTLTLPSGAYYEGSLFVDAGRGVAAELLTWLQSHAAAKDPHAQFFLASCYLDFDTPARDLNTAKIYLQRAADTAHAEAQFRLSVLLLDEDVNSSIALTRQAAAQDHPLAHEVLAGYLHTGRHLAQDFTAAILHYEAAARKGNVAAVNNLAWLLATAGDETIADPSRAIELIRPFVLYLGNWQHLDTLAAAHARLGDTALAERMQVEALTLARNLGEIEATHEMEARLALYRAALPYVE